MKAFSDQNGLAVWTHRHRESHSVVTCPGLEGRLYPFRLGKQISRQEGSREEEEFERGFHSTAIERPRPTDRNTPCPDTMPGRPRGATQTLSV